MLKARAASKKIRVVGILDRGGRHAITRLTWPSAVMTLTGQGRVRAMKFIE
jgi:hypothetical protein